MQSINVKKIQHDSSIYPRDKWNTNTVDQYADAMKGGAEFPPIILEGGAFPERRFFYCMERKEHLKEWI
jgi:hypothetical protein